MHAYSFKTQISAYLKYKETDIYFNVKALIATKLFGIANYRILGI